MTHTLTFRALGVAVVTTFAACARPTLNIPPAASALGPFDVVVANGKIVDGTGNPYFYGDVGIRGDRIVAVRTAGGLRNARTSRFVDAAGLVVAPGFIDIQAHSWDALLWRDGRVLSKVTQGVTTEILGEATTPAPSNDNIEQLQEIADMEPRRAELQRSFRGPRGFATWLRAMERNGNSVNVGSYLGAATVRAYVMAQTPGTPNAQQLEVMRTVVRNAMEDGAFGISTALIYPPGSFATTMELIEMAKAMAPYQGKYITHMRSEDDSLYQAMDEAMRIAREGGVSVDIYHLKASLRRNWNKAPGMVAKIDSARQAGFDVAATMYPYAFSGNNLGECFPDWASVDGKLFDNLRDSTTRARMLREMADPNGAPLCQHEGPAAYMIAGFRKPEHKKYEGKRLSEIAADLGKPWPETIVEITLGENRDLSKLNFTMSEDNVQMQIKWPWVVIGTDAGGMDPDSATGVTHPRAYGTYPRILGRYVREAKLFTLEDAVRKMSSAVAARLGIRDRGMLREGMLADVVIFDERAIIDRATPEQPHQLSIGVKHVWVNGVQVLTDGKHTGAKPGRAVRGSGWRGY